MDKRMVLLSLFSQPNKTSYFSCCFQVLLFKPSPFLPFKFSPSLQLHTHGIRPPLGTSRPELQPPSTYIPTNNQNDTCLCTIVLYCWPLALIWYILPFCQPTAYPVIPFCICTFNFPFLNTVFALAFIEFHHIDFGFFFQFIKIILNIIMSCKVPCPPKGASLFCNRSC